MEFKAFSKIERIGKLHMAITQKIHGSNAQIVIEKSEMLPKIEQGEPTTSYTIKAGSRTKYITPEDDNFGFARFVQENANEFIEKLGVGIHYGEWAGPGINSGEGLTEKTFILFDFWKYPAERPLPPRTMVVPVLYQGPLELAKIDNVMVDLKSNGSKLVPGFMRPEGVVITMGGIRYKKVFEAEETKWTKSEKTLNPTPIAELADVSHLLQPIRLVKLLSRDEKYLKDYPSSLRDICKDYTADLLSEVEIAGDEDAVRAIHKSLGKNVFAFVRSEMDDMIGKYLNQVG